MLGGCCHQHNYDMIMMYLSAMSRGIGRGVFKRLWNLFKVFDAL